MPKAPAQRPAAYEKVVHMMTKLGADDSKMFGMPTLKFEGKAFCGLWRTGMVFKLTGDDHATAVKLKGAHLFDPGEMGRPMKEWVVVPTVHAAKWQRFTMAAFHYRVGAKSTRA